MGINTWCSRWLGSPRYLLVALACAPGCTDQLADPGASPNAGSSSDAALVPATLLPAALVSEFPNDVPQQPLCGDQLLAVDFSLDESGLPTLYVDAATDAVTPDGSLAAPFRTLSAALLAGSTALLAGSDAAPGPSRALGPTRRVLVASGNYDEDVAIPPGTLLFGGYDAERWEQGAGPSVIGGSVYVGTATAPAGIVTPEGRLAVDDTATPSSPSAAPLTALVHFEVGGGVAVVPGARALLRDNVIAPVFSQAIDDPPGTRRAMAVWINAATVRADGNRLVVPAGDPPSIISAGFFAWNSCAWVTENEITDYRSPIYFYKGPGAAATFNVLRRAANGIGTNGNHALIAGNSIDAHWPLGGCVYAVTMLGDAHPDIRDNRIYLADWGNRGILEMDVASRPTALLGNRFSSPRSSPALYIHHRGPADPEPITTIGAVNALAGVPAVGNNTFARVAAAL
jgi:hypothetical protein